MAVVKVKGQVPIKEDCRINICGSKVTYCPGNAKKVDENFKVKGDDTQVTLNIMILNGKLNGKLKIDKKGGSMHHDGLFIIKKVESTDNLEKA